MILSIVIPMYNIEKYIDECINSCINQLNVSKEDYEIIIVNDGSTDLSEVHAKQYLTTHPNIKLVSQENGGLSSARNTGLKHATGEYVWFVDGDDKISDGAIETIFHNIKANKCQAYVFDYSTFDDTGKTTETSEFDLPSGIFSSKAFMFNNKCLMPMMTWLTVYSREFLNQHRLFFHEGIIHEDLEFCIKSFCLSEYVMFIKQPLYQYRINRKDSIKDKIKNDNTKSIVSLDEIIKSLKWFFNDNGFKGKDTIWLLACVSYINLLNIHSDRFVMNEATRAIIHKRKKYYKYMWNSGLFKYKLLAILFGSLPNWLLLKLCEWHTR